MSESDTFCPYRLGGTPLAVKHGFRHGGWELVYSELEDALLDRLGREGGGGEGGGRGGGASYDVCETFRGNDGGCCVPGASSEAPAVMSRGDFRRSAGRAAACRPCAPSALSAA